MPLVIFLSIWQVRQLDGDTTFIERRGQRQGSGNQLYRATNRDRTTLNQILQRECNTTHDAYLGRHHYELPQAPQQIYIIDRCSYQLGYPASTLSVHYTYPCKVIIQHVYLSNFSMYQPVIFKAYILGPINVIIVGYVPMQGSLMYNFFVALIISTENEVVVRGRSLHRKVIKHTHYI